MKPPFFLSLLLGFLAICPQVRAQNALDTNALVLESKAFPADLRARTSLWLFGPGYTQKVSSQLPDNQVLYLGSAGCLPLAVATIKTAGPDAFLIYETVAEAAPDVSNALDLPNDLKVWHLLTHSYSWTEGDFFRWCRPDSDSPPQVLDYLKATKPEQHPEAIGLAGRFNVYNLYGYGILQAIVEDRTQLPYFQYAKANLGFGPQLGWLPLPAQDLPANPAAEGLWGTPEAWTKWLSDLMAGRFISTDTVQRLLLSPNGPQISETMGAWGLGFCIYNVNGQQVAVLQATTNNSALLVAYLPDRKIGLVWFADMPPSPDGDPRQGLIKLIAAHGSSPKNKFQWEPFSDSLLLVSQKTAGTYRYVRYPRSGPEHWLGGMALLATITLKAELDGSLTAHSASLPAPAHLRLTNYGLWVDTLSGLILKTETVNDGEVTLLHTTLYGISTFEPAPEWTTLPNLTMWGLIFGLYCLIISIIYGIWAAYWWIKRKKLHPHDARYKHVPVSGLHGLRLRVEAAGISLSMAGVIGLMFLLLVDGSLTDIRYAPDVPYRILYTLPFITILAALKLWWDTFRQWRAGWFTVLGRLSHTILALIATLLARALCYWLL